MKTLIKILCLSVLWFSCENSTEPESDNEIIPDFLEICEKIYNDVDGSFESCSSNCESFSNDCYHLYDLQVLTELKNNNESLSDSLNLLQIGSQSWHDGRLRSIAIHNMSITYLPETFCNLGCMVSVEGNQLCDEYHYDCYTGFFDLDNWWAQWIGIGRQNISDCEGYSEYSGEWYYDNDITILSEIKDLNPSLNDTILLDIGIQDWYNGKLDNLDLSNLELIHLPESVCNLGCYDYAENLNTHYDCLLNVEDNQLCEEYNYDCITGKYECPYYDYDGDGIPDCDLEDDYEYNDYWEPQDCQE